MSRPDEAINYYHDLLAGRHLDSTRQVLDEATERESLSFGGRAICTVLRPYFITAEQYEYVRRASTLVMMAIAALGRRLMSDSRLRSELDLDAKEEEIIQVDTGYGSADVSARLDGFLSEEGDFNFVEYNAESPGGLGYGNALSDAFARMPIMREFSARYDARALPVRTFVFDALLAAYHRWGARGLPNVAIVDWRGVSTYSEFLLMQSEFESHGCQVRIADPEELEYRGGRLFVGDFAIDLVYKRVVTAELLAKYGTRHPLIDAVRDRAVCMANGFAVQMLYKKAVFALLSDTAISSSFGPEMASLLARHIPWTRKVREMKTDYKGRSIDLVEFVAGNRERLVLKPNSEYGGRGVVLGWECDPDDWRKALSDALNNSYIVQERVPLGREAYPSIVDGELRIDERYLDLDPYVWDGERAEGCGVRLSKLALLNVSAGGGSATPMFIIRDKA
ncbi:MAG TPA: hypothetical protein VKA70_01900 [Blastocatellia bacterium]|nr:hypothetical protein [Blastocatellia bacterium]